MWFYVLFTEWFFWFLDFVVDLRCGTLDFSGGCYVCLWFDCLLVAGNEVSLGLVSGLVLLALGW